MHNFLSRPLSLLGWTTAMLFWLDFHQAQTNLYTWFRMQRHDWSLTSPKEPMHLSLSPCTGYRLQLASSSSHWCLHIEQPQAQHPPTSLSQILKITLQNILVHNSKFSSCDSASVWKGIKDITSYKTPSPSTVENQQLADDLHEFYCRFEKTPLCNGV